MGIVACTKPQADATAAALASPQGQALVQGVDQLPGTRPATLSRRSIQRLTAVEPDKQMLCGALAWGGNTAFALFGPIAGASVADVAAEQKTMQVVEETCTGNTKDVASAVKTLSTAYVDVSGKLRPGRRPGTACCGWPACCGSGSGRTRLGFVIWRICAIAAALSLGGCHILLGGGATAGILPCCRDVR